MFVKLEIAALLKGRSNVREIRPYISAMQRPATM